MGKRQQTEKKSLMTRYLLGDLSEDEQVQVEEEFFANDDFFNELLIEEEELTERYLRHDMSLGEEEEFEAQLQKCPVQRRKVEFTKALREYASNATLEEPSLLMQRRRFFSWKTLLFLSRNQNQKLLWSFVTIVLIAVIGGSWLIARNARLEKEIDNLQRHQARLQEHNRELEDKLAGQGDQNAQLRAELETSRRQREDLEQQLSALARQNAGSSAGTIQADSVLLALIPRSARNLGALQTLDIRRGVKKVRLSINLEPDDYKSYKVILQTKGEIDVWKHDKVYAQPIANGKTITLNLQADLFTSQDYILIIKGLTLRDQEEDAGRYYFSVNKK